LSNIYNDEIYELIRDSVHELWVMKGRPDLEDDCCHYVLERYGENSIIYLVIEFLSNHCSQAMSTQDYEFARKEHDEKLLTNLKEMRDNAKV